jgi:hypothetical protein
VPSGDGWGRSAEGAGRRPPCPVAPWD